MKLLLQSFNEITENAEEVLIQMSETTDQNRLDILFEKLKVTISTFEVINICLPA